MLAAVAVFAIVLFLSITVFLGFNYYYIEQGKFADDAFAYARSAAKYIDGDKAASYLKSAVDNGDGTVSYVLDDYYLDIKRYLSSVKDEHELMKYYYVFVPNEDTVTYLWDANTDHNASMIGDTEEYMTGGKEAVDRIYNSDPVEQLQIYKDENWGYIACAFYPIFSGDGKPVAVVGVDLSMDSIRSAFVVYIHTIIIVITGVVVLASVIFYLLIRKRLVKPIYKLNTATKKIVSNLDSGEEFTIDIRTRDELEELARSFSAMTCDLREYIRRLSTMTAEKERIGAELDVASQIQADMLPRIFPAFPNRSEFDIYATMTPAKEVGGDFYDFFLVDEDHIALVMADVSGKGVPAALFMVIAKTLIKNHALLGESPAEILKHVNEQLCEGNETNLFVTVWIAIIDLRTGSGIAANAGHEHPALRRADGQFELVVYPHSPIVAVIEGMTFAEHSFRLNPGDSLFVYTDGVTEARNENARLFGTARMLTALNVDPSASPERLLQNVRRGIDEFVGNADRSDDITMMCFSYSGGKKEEPEEITLDAIDQNLDTVFSFVCERLENCGCDKKIRKQIKVATEELFLNIAHYAYAPDTGKVTVLFEHKHGPERAVVTFIDEGVAYDPLSKPDPDIDLPLEDRQIGGLGIFLAKKCADSINYERKDGKNVLAFEKRL